MLLYLKAKLNELNIDDVTFFRLSHIYMFGTDPDQYNAVAQFRLHGIIPIYVRNYLSILQSKEKS